MKILSPYKRSVSYSRSFSDNNMYEGEILKRYDLFGNVKAYISYNLNDCCSYIIGENIYKLYNEEEVAIDELDDRLLKLGYILTNSQEEFDKYKILL